MNALLAQVEDLITNKESVYIAITVVFWFIMRTYLVQFNTVSNIFFWISRDPIIIQHLLINCHKLGTCPQN
jgi:hypothetical protein